MTADLWSADNSDEIRSWNWKYLNTSPAVSRCQSSNSGRQLKFGCADFLSESFNYKFKCSSCWGLEVSGWGPPQQPPSRKSSNFIYEIRRADMRRRWKLWCKGQRSAWLSLFLFFMVLQFIHCFVMQHKIQFSYFLIISRVHFQFILWA